MPCACHQEEIGDHGELADEPRAKKPKRHPQASALPWPPRRELFPLRIIAGEPVPPEQIKPDKNPKLAAKFWCRRVAFEVGNGLPETEREAAERFCLRHRLSILNAFHRRLRRSDVVEAMKGLFHDE